MKAATAVVAGGLLASCAPGKEEAVAPVPAAAVEGGGETAVSPSSVTNTTDELGNPINTFEEITNYNNYYEFTTTKEDVAGVAAGYPMSPWQIEVGGLVKNPGIYDIDKIRQDFDQEERIYRLRCVETWAMVVPWMGFPLAKLLSEVEPTADAKYVRFETIYDPDNMPGQKSPWFEWPYVEGLRLDEAMNDLAILATGMYGQDLLPQNGGPIRLVVPWKYGFKSIKSIVKIDLVDEMPTSLWMASAPNEYGFYANVNPDVNHPRWSQGAERVIGKNGRQRTTLFNGYEAQVAHLYDGMSLVANF
jgi:sulfoxide reductase catalytic subunit YedY